MVRKVYVAFFAFLTAMTIGSQTTESREVLLDTDALRVETVGGEQVMYFSTFRAESDEYTIKGVSGRFMQQSNEMISIGTPEEPAVLQKIDAEPFSVSATATLQINLDDERLFASGDVDYQSEDTQAQSDVLRVDVKENIWADLSDVVDAMPEGEPRDLVIQFFDRLDPGARVILLQGNVRVETEDASLRAAWVALEESDSESFVSVADPDVPLQLRVRVNESKDSTEATDVTDNVYEEEHFDQ